MQDADFSEQFASVTIELAAFFALEHESPILYARILNQHNRNAADIGSSGEYGRVVRLSVTSLVAGCRRAVP